MCVIIPPYVHLVIVDADPFPLIDRIRLLDFMLIR